MSLEGKKVKESYKDLIHANNNNDGIGTTQKQLHTGKGDALPLKVGTRGVSVAPGVNTNSTFQVSNAAGTNLLTVDSTNKLVKAGTSQHIVNQQYKEFGLWDFSPNAVGKHHPMIAINSLDPQSAATFTAHADFGGGGTDPVTSLDIDSDADFRGIAMACMWYVPTKITITEARILATADDTMNLNFHIYSYDLDTSSNHGDLSNGTLIAHAGSSLAMTNAVLKTTTLTIDSAIISSGKVIMVFAENETDADDFTCRCIVNYYLT
tara:strand:+ start:5604 stop:6398 length:795 start_codon:yes stop_codon:yes gene_type:complete